MNNLIKIENNPNIFYMTAGLVNDEYTYWHTADGNVYDLICEIQKIDIDSGIREWFNHTKTEMLTTNPYWPRGFAMIVATLFIKDGNFFLNEFMDYFQQFGSVAFYGADFHKWIANVPNILSYMENKFAGTTAWKKWHSMIDDAAGEWKPVMDEAERILADFYKGSTAPNVAFTPNLLTDLYDVNYIRMDNKVDVITYWPDTEIMMRGALHAEISKHSNKIATFVERYGLRDFADISKYSEYGYRHDHSNESCVRIISECFVRGISAVLSGGGIRRLAVLANYGFGSAPFIGQCFMEMRPKAKQLDGFIDRVLCGFAADDRDYIYR